MDEGRRRCWAIYFAPLLLAGLAATPARADRLVIRLNQESAAIAQIDPACCVMEEQAKTEPAPQARIDENALALSVLATVLFSNPDNPPPQTGGTSGGPTGGTSGGGGNPGPSSQAPEPATFLSALVGSGLAALYAGFRRKRLMKMENVSAA
jgi:hypothetical protein